ncbi:MAG TPA: hypothetical protein VIJ62_12350 [Rhizomicrobium sp.]
MGWIVIILLMILCVLVWLYWLSVRSLNRMTNYLMLVLLDETNYRKQCNSLRSLVSDLSSASEPKGDNAVEFSMKITFITGQLIGKANAGKLASAVTALLWEMKKASASPGAANTPSL